MGISAEVKEVLERVHADLSGERRIHEVRRCRARLLRVGSDCLTLLVPSPSRR